MKQAPRNGPLRFAGAEHQQGTMQPERGKLEDESQRVASGLQLTALNYTPLHGSFALEGATALVPLPLTSGCNKRQKHWSKLPTCYFFAAGHSARRHSFLPPLGPLLQVLSRWPHGCFTRYSCMVSDSLHSAAAMAGEHAGVRPPACLAALAGCRSVHRALLCIDLLAVAQTV